MRLKTSVFYGYTYTDILLIVFGILRVNVKIVIIFKPVRIQNLVFIFFHRSFGINPYQLIIWISPVSILIEIFHVRMGGSIIQIVIQFLDIFSMVPLRAGQSKQP